MSKLTQIQDEYIKQEYCLKCKSTCELARELNVSEWLITDHLKRMGVSIRRQGGGLKTVDITNKRFGSYTVVRKLYRPNNKQGALWQVVCDCGNIREVLSKFLRKGEATSCGNCLPHPAWKGVGQMSGQYFATILKNAKVRNLEFDLTKEYLWDLFLKQNKKCALSGLDIHFVRDRSSVRSCAQTASLDRIDSTIGYTKPNVQWVHKTVNLMKMHLDQTQFIKLCKLIASRQKNVKL